MAIAVDETTSLQEMFIVRPASRILDYVITDELRDDTHYEVTIEAVELCSVQWLSESATSYVTLFRRISSWGMVCRIGCHKYLPAF